LLNADNGIFQRNAQALTIAKNVIAECLTVAHASGIMLDGAEVLDGLLLISKASDGQLISTLQDINNKRPTEIDTLNFEIVRIAERLNRGGLVPETRLLGELTAIKSQLNMAIG
jgi:2-dehydropantoate 2-reductase